jgi:hypothetical protein
MSSSNAAAIRRRAGINPPTPTPAPTSNQRQSSSASSSASSAQSPDAPRKLTLPEVISVFDKRISKLEENLKSTSNQTSNTMQALSDAPSNLNEILGEFNMRFEVLADEISTLKDTILRLQTFTMDVNKMLLNERVRVLSDLGPNIQMSNDEADINSVFSLASESANVGIQRESPTTSVDMREELGQ